MLKLVVAALLALLSLTATCLPTRSHSNITGLPSISNVTGLASFNATDNTNELWYDQNPLCWWGGTTIKKMPGEYVKLTPLPHVCDTADIHRFV